MNTSNFQNKIRGLLQRFENEMGELTFVLFSKKLESDQKIELLIKHGFLSENLQDFSDDFKELTFKSKKMPGFVLSSFPNDAFDFRESQTQGNSFLENFLSTIELYKELLPTYEDRSSTFRKRVLEIPVDIFASALAVAILNVDITYNVIAIEQNDTLKALFIKYYKSFMQDAFSKRAVELLTLLNLLPYNYYSINAKSKKNGLLIQTYIGQRTIQHQLNYHSNQDIAFKYHIYPLNESELEILSMFNDDNVLYQRDILSKTRLSKRMVNYSLESLIKGKLLIRHGEKGRKNTYYSKK